MIALAFAFAYASWAALAFAMRRHASRVNGLRLAPPAAFALRLAGAGGLASSLHACTYSWGLAIGAVAWFGVMSAAALAFVVLLSFTPKIAFGTALLAVPAGFAATFVLP